MSSLFLSERAHCDIERLTEFLVRDHPHAAESTAELTLHGLAILQDHPLIGRSVDGIRRELVISRGNSGYVALYEFQRDLDRALIHAIRHQRESGFEE